MNNKLVQLFCFIFALFGLNLTVAGESNVYSNIARLHLPSVSVMSQEQQLDNILRAPEIPVDDKKDEKKKDEKKEEAEPEVTEQQKLELLFKVFTQAKSEEMLAPVAGSGAHLNVYKDLEVLCGNNPERLQRHLLGVIDNTTTLVGRICLAKMLYNVTNDVTLLHKRQAMVRALLADEKLLNEIRELLVKVKESEAAFLWFWQKMIEEVQRVHDEVYFDWPLNKLNTNATALEVLHLFQLIPMDSIPDFLINTALTYHLSPVITKEHQFSLKNGLVENWIENHIPTTWMDGLERRHPFINDPQFKQAHPYYKNSLYIYYALNNGFYLYGWYWTIKNVIAKYKTTSDIQKKMIAVATYVTSIEKVGQLLNKHAAFQENLSTINLISDPATLLKDDKGQEHDELVKLFHESALQGQPRFFSNKGKALAAFKMMQESKQKFVKLMEAVGEVDALVSVATLYKKHEGGAARYTFVEYLPALHRPYVSITGYWSPFVSTEKAIINNVQLGGAMPQNMLLTGPNAGGKSTHLKAISIGMLMAHTLGIAPAQRMVITPFTYIDTYLNISDDAGHESLFQAEMHRVLQIIKTISALKSGEFSFVIMDEIFTGTNPREGMAGAYGIAKKIGSIPNGICLFATHFKKLTELETVAPERFKNYKVTAIKNADGIYSYPYTLDMGISQQAIALDLLKNDGFDDEILRDAYSVLTAA